MLSLVPKSIRGLTTRNVSMKRLNGGSRALVDRTRSCGDGKFVWHSASPLSLARFVARVYRRRIGLEMVLVATSNKYPVL